MILYSKSTGGFYDSTQNSFVPTDGVEVSRKDYLVLLEGQGKGKCIVAGNDGYPVLNDLPPLPKEVLVINERDWRLQQLTVTDGVVARHRDEVEEGIHITLTTVQYAELQAYRRALRNWPEVDEFPLINSRPQPPKWLSTFNL